MPEITGVLLAAGHSQRFGGNKLLAEIDRREIIMRAADSLSPCTRILAVIRRDNLPLQQLLSDTSIELVFNDRVDSEMGASISCGVAASQHSEGWCLMPADMPFVHPSTTRSIVNALLNHAALAAPFYAGKRGHPVGFSASLKDELLTLESEPGARRVIARHLDQLLIIESTDAAVLLDIDTPEDLQRHLQDDTIHTQ